MSVYHRTQRLQIYGDKPEVTQLFNDRYRIVVRCKAARDTEAWYNDNKSQIFADFGTLYNAQMSIDGIESRTGEAYDNMVLVSNAVGYTQTGEYVVTFVYETLTATWTKEQEDTVSSTDNGLRVVERSEVATIEATAPYDEDDIGVSTITSGGKTLYLAGFKDETKAESDAQIGRVTTQWLEAGTLSETLDNVGSQKAKVIEAIGPDPATPSGYSLASKQESSFNGFQTNRFTFLKNNVQLSQSEDKVGSQLAISQQWFNPDADKTLAGYSLASKNTSDFEGIETVEFRFLKDDVVLSESEDKVGSQLAITKEVFNGTPSTPSGYSIANEQESNVDGIPTRRFTFLKDDVELSRSEDNVGSQLAITTEVFNPTNDPTETGYSLARVEVSDVDGIPTKRFTFLKDDVELSRTNDYVGSQLAITREFFNPTSDPTETGYSLASKQQSDFEGIKTVKYVFLRNNVLLSQSIDQVGSQNAIVEEWFNPSNRNEKIGYSVARREESNIDGIPTERYTFMRDCILRVDTPKVGGSQRVSVQAFDMTEAEVTADLAAVTANHELISIQESDYEGIKTSTFVFEVNDFEVRSKTENGLQVLNRTELSITNFTDGDVGTDTYSGLYLAGEEIDNGNSIKKKESQWAEAGVLREDKRNISDGLVEHSIQTTISAPTTVGPIVSQSTSNVNGLPIISTVDIRKSDGNAPIADDGAGNDLPTLINSYETNVLFTYPGVVKAEHDVVSSKNIIAFVLRPPVEANVKAKIFIFLQTDSEISASDYTYDSSDGYWNPTEWAEAYHGGITLNFKPFSETQALRGYRCDTDISGIQTFGSSGTTTYVTNGVTVSSLSTDSLDAYEGELFEYSNNGGAYAVPADTLWTGQTSGAKAIARSAGGVSSGTFVFSRDGTGTNTIPFQVGENVRSSQFGGNQKQLTKYSGSAAYVTGVGDINGNDFSLNGKPIYASTPFMLRLSNGPENPVGKKWVLDVKIEPAFEALDGTKYYKKTIVTANVV